MRDERRAMSEIPYSIGERQAHSELLEIRERVRAIERKVERLAVALKAAQPYASRWHRWAAMQIGTAHDAAETKFSLEGMGFFELIEQADRLDQQIKDALAAVEEVGR
jgi:hypothetical protein